jgi:hypothetical protein
VARRITQMSYFSLRLVKHLSNSWAQQSNEEKTEWLSSPGALERLAEEFVKLSTDGEGVNRNRAQLIKMLAELNEKYDSEFVGPPL